MTGREILLARALYRAGVHCPAHAGGPVVACDDCLRACEPIAQALTAAGIGSLHDAWEKGVYASTSGATNHANPYPK